MADTTTHDDGARRPRRGGRRADGQDDPRRTPDDDEARNDRIAAVGGDAEDALDHEEPLESFELHEDDEDVRQLGADSLLDETPVPDDPHLADFEQQGRVRQTPKGPPNHQRLSSTPEEMGARFLEGITQTDPTDDEEARELLDELPTDKELDIRGGEEEEVPPEELPARWPSTPTGSG